MLDRAVLDALCRAEAHRRVHRHPRQPSRPDRRRSRPTSPISTSPGFLAELHPAPTIEARHTVGLVDPITAADQTERVDDGLPETLEEVVATYGHRWFKLKVGGDLQADLDRLARIAAVLDRLPAYQVTLDGNEQYADAEAALALWRAIAAHPAPAAPRRRGRLHRAADPPRRRPRRARCTPSPPSARS